MTTVAVALDHVWRRMRLDVLITLIGLNASTVTADAAAIGLDDMAALLPRSAWPASPPTLETLTEPLGFGSAAVGANASDWRLRWQRPTGDVSSPTATIVKAMTLQLRSDPGPADDPAITAETVNVYAEDYARAAAMASTFGVSAPSIISNALTHGMMVLAARNRAEFAGYLDASGSVRPEMLANSGFATMATA